jgi:hypothetical protein
MSGCEIEEMVDELDLSRQIISCHPSNLPLPDHVHCFVALKDMFTSRETLKSFP